MTVTTKEKVDCMAQAEVRKYIYALFVWFYFQRALNTELAFPERPFLDKIFIVAASRLGRTQNPKWCFPNVPVNSSIVLHGFKTADLNITDYIMTARITSEFRYFTFAEAYERQTFACETL